jgi:hypothetical protein
MDESANLGDGPSKDYSTKRKRSRIYYSSFYAKAGAGAPAVFRADLDNHLIAGQHEFAFLLNRLVRETRERSESICINSTDTGRGTGNKCGTIRVLNGHNDKCWFPVQGFDQSGRRQFFIFPDGLAPSS